MQNKRILIIGGTGSWGTALLSQLLKTDVSNIKLFSRNESNMVAQKQRFSDERVQAVLGDIRDQPRLMQACKDTDIIFHLAAVKHVPICEQMPTEAILTNVTGTQNVIDCALRNHVEKVIYASTDKAISPHCTYGCTKLLGEKLILSADAQTKETKFIVFRSGNLLGSSGSVIPVFKRQIAQSKCISLTDRRMNRFFIPVDQAASLLIEAAVRGAGGEVFLPRMDSISICDIAKYLLEQQGLDESHIQVTGIRPGEQLNENMVTSEESKSIYQINPELYTLIEHDEHSWAANGFVGPASYSYRSEDAILPYEQARQFLMAANI